LLLACAAWPWTSVLHAQASARGEKRVRVGILTTGRSAGSNANVTHFIEAMRELAWIEGRNIVYDRVYAEADESRLSELAAALVARRPDVIHIVSVPVVKAVLAQTRTIPVVFGAVNDPVAAGFVKDLSRPGGNATGIANIGWELGGKRMQLLKEAMPKLRRVGVLVNPLSPSSSQEQKLIEQTAGAEVQVIPGNVKEAAGLDAAFVAFAQSRVEAVLTTHINLFFGQAKRIMELAMKQRIPAIGHRNELAEAGALMTYSSRLDDQIRRSAHLVDKILKGAKTVDIPVELPTKFELVVNLKIAKALGITVPQSVLLQASRVIE
jgi:putative tryptophan/tyrosine transport system substrate-binding protein